MANSREQYNVELLVSRDDRNILRVHDVSATLQRFCVLFNDAVNC
jgi:hypothetical protein